MTIKDKGYPASISVVVPALNEEETVETVITNIISSCKKNNLESEIIIVDDGSTDNTRSIILSLSDKFSSIVPVYHDVTRGIGASFREGVKRSSKEIITWLPADGENDIEELIRYMGLFRYVDIVIPFVVNTGIRNWWRRILSSLYLFIINFSFGTTFNYTNGNIMYRKGVFDNIENRSNGFFCHTECLIKSIRSGLMFAEVPVSLNRRSASTSKALSLSSLIHVTADYLYLFAAIHILRNTGGIKQRVR